VDVRALAAEPGRVYAGTTGNGTFVMGVATSAATNLLGRSLTIKNPGVDSRRTITVAAQEAHANETLDPAALAARGATLDIAVRRGQYQPDVDLPPPWSRRNNVIQRHEGILYARQEPHAQEDAPGTFTLSAQIAGTPARHPSRTLFVPPHRGRRRASSP
jgi:hypothetical protein